MVLQRHWESVVPAEFKAYSSVIGLSHKRLQVAVANGAVAARLKLTLPLLLKGLKSHGLDLTAIRFEVQVVQGASAQPKPLRYVPDEAAKTLGGLAEKLAGTALGDSLQRLATRTQLDK